jgi:pimeloyl-ACP methyl ester carboxylesterase
MVASSYRRARPRSSSVSAYEIAIPDALLNDMRERIRNTRWLNALPGAGWDFGTSDDALRALCERWLNEFDWRAHEAKLNSYPNVMADFDGATIHAIDARSADSGSLPLVMFHGWPSTVSEFLPVVDALTGPAANGASTDDAFDVIAVSLPGFGFSGPTRDRNWDAGRMASAVSELLTELGVDRYGIFGTDAGVYVASALASIDESRAVGLYLHVGGVLLGRAARLDPELNQDPTDAEQEALRAVAQYDAVGGAYALLNATKPHSLAYALGDSPVGQAAWILEKFHEWTDHNGSDGVAGAVPIDDLLAIITTYWVTGTAGSSARFYADTGASIARSGLPSVNVPTGCGAFPGDVVMPSRRWAQRRYPSLVHWTEMPRGGHFSALEVPDLLVADLRTFFRPLRSSSE